MASRHSTAIPGPRFKTSTDLIEIDVTYRCSLRCYNCDRSSTQAPDTADMTVEQLERFIHETRSARRAWRRIRIMGGEPFLHPDVGDLLALFSDLKREHSDTLIEVVTNGYGESVRNAMRMVPPGIVLKNTNKRSRFQRKFEAFNLAPVDEPGNAMADFSNGCWITEECGIGLNAYGFYPCGAGGSIDRVFGFDIGRKRLPPLDDSMADQKRRLCALCGHFSNGRFVPIPEREPVVGEPQSDSWVRAYGQYRMSKPVLSRY